MTPVLEVVGLRTRYPIRRGVFRTTREWRRAVDDVSFTVAPGQTLGLVGESGSGKTTVGLSVLRLVRPYAGQIRFDGVDLLCLGRRALRAHRRRLQVVFQDTLTSLDPEFEIARIVAEGLDAFRVGSSRERVARVELALEQVGLDPAAVMHRQAAELSGGQRQRVAIARALVLDPALIVCDEPTSALDVSVQAQIVNLLGDLQKRSGIAYLFITHNLALVRVLATHLAVMYAGQIVEYGPVDAIFDHPSHPYTCELLSSIPTTDPALPALVDIRAARDILHSTSRNGCRFADRCPFVMDRCLTEAPPLFHVGAVMSRCFLNENRWSQGTEQNR